MNEIKCDSKFAISANKNDSLKYEILKRKRDVKSLAYGNKIMSPTESDKTEKVLRFERKVQLVNLHLAQLHKLRLRCELEL